MIERDNYYPDEDNDFDQEEPNEFERRKQSDQRESAKRQRADQKYARLEQIEGEIGRKGHGTDRRFLEKDAKRKFAELKRIADGLGIKQTLQNISRNASYDCWGPDVVSDKSRPSIGIVLNYAARGAVAVPAQTLKIHLFGAWLYYADRQRDQISIVVATKELNEDSGQMERAGVPDKRQALTTLSYSAETHDAVQAQLVKLLTDWTPSN